VLLREGIVGERLLDRSSSAALVSRNARSFSITRIAFSRAATMSSPAWIALSMANVAEDVLVSVHDTPLPGCFGEELRSNAWGFRIVCLHVLVLFVRNDSR
jgi:hypothetical protein